MTTSSSRFLYSTAVIALVGAWLYGLGSGGSALGVVSLGYKGGVGDHLGYSVLIGLAVASLALGVTATLLADPPVTAGAEVDPLPAAEVPRSFAPWPALGGFGLGLAAVGLVSTSLLFIAGCVVLFVTLVEWAVQDWADRATGDPEVNRQIRTRVMQPIEIPVIGLAVIAFVVLGISRVLLALSKEGAAVFAIIVGIIVLGAAIVASRPKVSRNVITGMLMAGAVLVLAGGITAAIVGEREFEEHGGEGHGAETEDHGDEGGDDFELNTPGGGTAPSDDDTGRTEPVESGDGADAGSTDGGSDTGSDGADAGADAGGGETTTTEAGG